VRRSGNRIRQSGVAVTAGRIELRLGQEQAAGQVGSRKIGAAQIGTDDVGPPQIRAAQIGADQQGSAQVRTAQVGPAQLGADEIRTPKLLALLPATLAGTFLRGLALSRLLPGGPR